MKLNTLSKIDLHHGYIKMPKGFEIDREKLSIDIFTSTIYNKEFPFSKSWDMLQTYLREHINLEYNFLLISKKTTANIYKSNECSKSFLQVDPVDLKNSPDYVMIYGVNIEKDSCKVIIDYDDNRRKGRNWEIPLENNKFIMFPSTQRYFVKNSLLNQLNLTLTTTYDYI